MKKMVSQIVAFSIAAAGAVAPVLANDTMDAMIGAAVTYSYADGTTVKATYAADGSYTTDVAGGGTWTIDGDKLCIRTEAGDEGCTTLAAGKGAGDSWQGKDAFGNDVTITIG